MKQRLMRVFSRTARDRARELDEELDAHLAMRAADLEAQGYSPREARQEALTRFGDLDAARKDIYAASFRRDLNLEWRERADDVKRDLGVAVRRARARPGHTLVTLAIFALGVGISTVMFAITDNVVFRTLPFPDSDRLVSLQSVPQEGAPFPVVSMGNWYDWKEQSRTLEGSALYREIEVGVAVDGEVSRVPAAYVSGRFFETLAVPMTIGRPFSEAESLESARLLVVSEGFWRRALGGAPDLSGRALSLNGVDYAVAGVMPHGREFPEGTDIWIPSWNGPRSGEARNYIHWLSLGRLAEGATLEQAAADLSSIADGIRESDPEGVYSWGVHVEPLREAVLGETAGNLLMLQGAVLLFLLVACANLMGLEFAGVRERGEELAVRISLGAGRGRLLQQLLTEQVALALVGGALGLALAGWGTSFVMNQLGSTVPRAHEVSYDVRVVLAGVGLSLVAGILASLGPAWRASRHNPAGALASTRSVRGGRGLPGSSLVTAEVALTVILLTGGGLLLRSMGVLVNRDLGYDPTGVVTLDISLSTPEYYRNPERVAPYWTALLTSLQETPGVAGAAAANWIPTGGGGSGFIELPGVDDPEVGAGYRVVSDRYFEVMGVPLLQGRYFGPDDQTGTARVAIVNQTMARAFWPGEDPIGKRVKAVSMEGPFFEGEAPWLTVVGVVADMRHRGFEEEARQEMFTLYRQIPNLATIMAAVVRVQPGSTGSVMVAARDRARAIDPALAVQTGLLEGRVHGLLAERRMVTSILAAFGGLALVLASLGIYGILALAVAARTREMAIRSALGAGRSGLVGLVVSSGLKVVALGLLAGAAGGYALRGFLSILLVEVRASDPITLLLVTTVVMVSGVAASLFPAVRAARMEPLEALREG